MSGALPCVSCHASGDTTRPQDDPPSLTTDERLLLVLCRLLGGFWLWLEERRTTLHLETKGGTSQCMARVLAQTQRSRYRGTLVNNSGTSAGFWFGSS